MDFWITVHPRARKMSKATYSQKVIQNSRSTTLSSPQICSQKYRAHENERETTGEGPSAEVPRSKLISARRPRASSRPTSWCKTTPGRCLYLTSKFLSTIFRFVLCWNDNIDLHFHVQIKVNEKKPRTPHKSRKTQLRVSKAHILLWHTTAPSLAQKQTHSRKIRKNCFSHPH